MEKIKERMFGAAVVVALGVIFLPMLFTEDKHGDESAVTLDTSSNKIAPTLAKKTGTGPLVVATLSPNFTNPNYMDFEEEKAPKTKTAPLSNIKTKQPEANIKPQAVQIKVAPLSQSKQPPQPTLSSIKDSLTSNSTTAGMFPVVNSSTQGKNNQAQPAPTLAVITPAKSTPMVATPAPAIAPLKIAPPVISTPSSSGGVSIVAPNDKPDTLRTSSSTEDAKTSLKSETKATKNRRSRAVEQEVPIVDFHHPELRQQLMRTHSFDQKYRGKPIKENRATPYSSSALTSKRKSLRKKKGSWSLQVGAFSSENNAYRLVEQLRGQGYPAHAHKVDKGYQSMTVVQVGPNNEAGVMQWQEDIRSTFNLNAVVLPDKEHKE